MWSVGSPLEAVLEPSFASLSQEDAEAEATLAAIAADCSRAQKGSPEDRGAATQVLLRVWEAAGQVILKDVVAGRIVSLHPLGLFARGEHEDQEEEAADVVEAKPSIRGPQVDTAAIVVSFYASEEFQARYGLEAARRDAPPSGPRTRCSIAAVARAASVERDVASDVLRALIDAVGAAMERGELVAVSFSPLGTLHCVHGSLDFVPVKRPMPSLATGGMPTTVKEVLLQQSPVRSGPASPRSPARGLGGRDSPRSILRAGSSPKAPLPAAKAAELASRLLAAKVAAAGGSYPKAQSPPAGAAHRVASSQAGAVPGASAPPASGLERTAPTESQLYPPLLSEGGRTLAVPYSGPVEAGSPSSRIAASYSGRAARLTTKMPGVPPAQRVLRWLPEQAVTTALPKQELNYGSILERLVADGSDLDLEIQQAGLERGAFYECLHRYGHYVREGVPSSSVTPYNVSWTSNIERMLYTSRFSSEPDAALEGMFAAMEREVADDYYAAMKKAIVDCVLEDEAMRRRVGVPFVPCPPMAWGAGSCAEAEGALGATAEVPLLLLAIDDPCSFVDAHLLSLSLSPFSYILS